MLSGGERARLLLAKLSMQNNNFLILDEPTNHLDIDSKEVLEDALIDFDGLFVTFHRIAFTNDGWLLNPRTDLLIRLMPESFFIRLGLIGASWAIAGPLLLETGARILLKKERQ